MTNRDRATLGVVLALALSALMPGNVAWSAPPGSTHHAAAQWHQAGLAGTTVHALVAGRKDPTLLVAGTEKGVYRRDRAGHWHKVLTAPAVWSVDLAKGDTAVAGDNDGDVYVGRPDGRHWRHTNVTPLGVFAVSFEPGSTTHMLAGGGDGVYISRDAGRHWQRRLALKNSGTAAFAWKPGSAQIVLAGAVARSAQGSTQVYISKNAGRTWHVFGHDLDSLGGIMSLGVTASQVFAGTMGNAVWAASLLTGAWHQAADGMPASNDHVAGILTLPGQPKRIVVGTLGYGVFQSNDGGKHWTDFSHDSPLARSGGIVLSVAYSRAAGILAGTADGVYELTTATKK